MSRRPLKILFLTRYPVAGASSRYRVFQYISHLEALDVSCTVHSFMDQRMYQLSFAPRRTFTKVIATLAATAKRLWGLRKWREYDAIYLQRELLPFGPPIIERWLKRRGAVLFFDYDDALFIKQPSRYSPIATFFRSPEKIWQIFQLVDCVVAGNNWLRDAARGKGGRAETIEVAEDTDRIRVNRSPGAPITIGWLGSKTTSKYLRLIEPVLQDIAAKHPDVRFEIVGGGDFDMEGVPWIRSEWSMEEELAALSRFDIGLMPLPLNDWAKGKSGGKARTYMAAGVAPVVTGIGYNLELIKDGETGLLCENHDDWAAALNRLINDPDLRDQIGDAARADVETRFSVSGKAAELRALFDDVLDGRGRS